MKSNELPHGAINAGIFMFLLFAVGFVPIANFIALFLLPIPLIIHMTYYGWRGSVLTGIVILLCTLFLFSPLMLFIAFSGITVGIVMGYCYRLNKGSFLPALSGMVVYIINFIILILISYFVLDINVADAVEQMIADSAQLSGATADWLNMAGDEQLQDAYEETLRFVWAAFPALLMIGATALATIHHLVSRMVMERLGIHTLPWPPFRNWNVPKSVLYYYLIALVLMLINVFEEGSSLYMITVNAHMILGLLVLIQGLSVIAYYSFVKNIGRWLTIVCALLCFFPLFAFIIRLIGILDFGINVKQRISPK